MFTDHIAVNLVTYTNQRLGDLHAQTNQRLAWVHGEVSIGVFFTLGVVPEVDRHGGEGFQADQFTWLPIHGFTCCRKKLTYTGELLTHLHGKSKETISEENLLLKSRLKKTSLLALACVNMYIYCKCIVFGIYDIWWK